MTPEDATLVTRGRVDGWEVLGGETPATLDWDVTMGEDVLWVRNATLSGPAGRLDFSGRLPFAWGGPELLPPGELDVRLEGQGLDLAAWPLLPMPAPMPASRGAADPSGSPGAAASETSSTARKPP